MIATHRDHGLEMLIHAVVNGDRDNRDRVIRRLLQACNDCGSVEGLEVLARLRRQEAEQLRAKILPLPIEEPTWMTVTEVDALGLGYSRATLKSKLENHDNFQKQRAAGNHRVEYLVTPDNVGFLDRTGIVNNALTSRRAHSRAEERLDVVMRELARKGIHEVDGYYFIDIDPKAEYTYENAAEMLSVRDRFYSASAIKMMVDSGHLQAIRRKVTGQSLIGHLKYMHGKRFVDTVGDDELEDILKVVNSRRTRDLSPSEIREQIRRGATELIGYDKSHRANEVRVVNIVEDEIIAMISIGLWLYSGELRRLGASPSSARLSQILHEYENDFHTRKIGRNVVGYVTLDNAAILRLDPKTLGINAEAIQGIPRVSELSINSPKLIHTSHTVKVSFKATSRDYQIETQRGYNLDFFTEVLGNIDGDIFRRGAVSPLFSNLRGDRGSDTILGSSILATLDKASDALFLGHEAYTYLSAEAGVNIGEVQQLMLQDADFKKYVRFLGSNLFPYVSNSDVENITRELHKKVYGADDWQPMQVATQARLAHIPETAIRATADQSDVDGVEKRIAAIQAEADARIDNIQREADDRVRAAEQRATAVKQDNGKRAAALQRQAALEATKQVIPIGRSSITLYGGETYKSEHVKNILTQVHPSAFCIDAIVDRELQRTPEGITGDSLIAFVLGVNGLMLIDSTSTVRKLGDQFGFDTSEIEQGLSHAECSQYVHERPGIVRGKYVLAHELDDLKAAMYNALHIGKKTTSTSQAPAVADNALPAASANFSTLIGEYDHKLHENGIHLKPRMYHRLLELGILDQSSEANVRRTYESFIEEMNGWEFLDHEDLKNRLDCDWRTLHEGPMARLMDDGLVKNIARELMPDRGGKPTSIYVVQKGRLDDVYTTLGIPIREC